LHELRRLTPLPNHDPLEEHMHRATLSQEEIRAIRALLAEVATQYTSVEDADFIRNAAIIAHELPRRIRVFLDDFKRLELPPCLCVISAFPLDNVGIGPTPEHWKSKSKHSSTLESEMLFVLFGSLLGDLIGWAMQQGGHLIHEVMPIKSDENTQISTGSKQVIWWHTEDAFHPYRGDYVGLMCLRNPALVPTTFNSMDRVHISPRHLKILFEPRFIIRPDESHVVKTDTQLREHENNYDAHLQIACEQIRQMHLNPPKMSILYGSPLAPYIRIDPYFMDQLKDEEAQSALNSLIHAVDASLSEIVLQPGDYLFLDNYLAVHGRKPFTAKYDGSDRWLKRINITRDLRKSRSTRINTLSRIIF
jgi:Fe(II)/alpha-ketoglutarate-dependent arginine beta-hydroxylase